MSTSLVAPIITVVGSVAAAIIGAYVAHRLRSNPNEEQANLQEGNGTTTNNQLNHQDHHNRLAFCCFICQLLWGRRERAPPPPSGTASHLPSGVATTPQAPPVETTPQAPPVETTVPQAPPVETTVPQAPPVETTVLQAPPVETTVPQAPPVETTVPQAPPVETLQPVVPLITVGSWGYPEYGKDFDFNDLDDIKIIRIFSDSVINSIGVQYRKNQELYSWTGRVGGDEGSRSSQEVVLEDGEYIIEVTGYCGIFDEIGTLNSLTFHTNKNKTLGPYGSEGGEKSTQFKVKGGKIVGFYGTAEKYIHAIGFYVLPVVDPLVMSRDVPLIAVGCWGNPNHGDSFSHSGYNDIKTIKISADAVIDSIQVEYLKLGTNEWTPKVGGRGGTAKPKVTLEDGEYINEVNGSYGKFSGRRAINSLTFYTSRNKKVGPFGKRYNDKGAPEPTDFKVEGGRIVGFYGTSGKYLYSIGFYVSPLI